jgi:hypothetical protein
MLRSDFIKTSLKLFCVEWKLFLLFLSLLSLWLFRNESKEKICFKRKKLHNFFFLYALRTSQFFSFFFTTTIKLLFNLNFFHLSFFSISLGVFFWVIDASNFLQQFKLNVEPSNTFFIFRVFTFNLVKDFLTFFQRLDERERFLENLFASCIINVIFVMRKMWRCGDLDVTAY